LSWELLGALGLAMVVDRTNPMPTPELDESATLLVLP